VPDEMRVAIATDTDVVTARQITRQMANEMGFSSTDVVAIATAVSELGRNIVSYADHGEIILSPARLGGRRGITVVARDRGRGIPDISLAMQDGYSTAQSLGLGLPGTKRLMDTFDIVSEVGKGTTVTTTKWVPQR
jgi:serine/threonine-protein kinase RsbT